MKYRFLKLLFLFSIVFTTQIKGEDGKLCNSAFSNSLHSAHLGIAKGNRAPYIYFLGLNGSFQIYRAQSQRGGNFVKSLLLNTCWFNTSFKSLSVSFLRAGAGHISSHKLILFPFHDFW
jgi:hypothetical protein